MLAEAEQAEALVMQAQAEPHGRIRFSCPTGILEPISGLIATFLARYQRYGSSLSPQTARSI